MFKKIAFLEDVVEKILTAKGDLLVSDSEGSVQRLPLQDGVLLSDSSSSVGISWKQVVVSSSKIERVCFVTRNNSQSFSTWTETKVLLNNVVYDNGNFFDSQNSRIIPTVSGYYLCIGQLFLSLTSSTSYNMLFCIIKKNGITKALTSILGGGTVSPGHNFGALTFRVIDFNGSTDYIELWTSVSTDASLILETGCNFLSVIGPLKELS